MNPQLRPFFNEPDFFEETYSGFKAVGRRNLQKAWCGYVGVPSSHPLFGKDYNTRVEIPENMEEIPDAPIELMLEGLRERDDKISLALIANCHGALTYAGDKWPLDDGLWYFGFDCSHYNDLTPQMLMTNSLFADTAAVYRTESYVKQNCKQLAAALEKLA